MMKQNKVNRKKLILSLLVGWQNSYKDNYGYDFTIEVGKTIDKYLLDGSYKLLLDYEKQSIVLRLSIHTQKNIFYHLYTLWAYNKKTKILRCSMINY